MVELKYWEPLAALAVLALLFGAWQADRAVQYRNGRADEAAKISLTLAEVANKQAAAAREKERRAAAELAERQPEYEGRGIGPGGQNRQNRADTGGKRRNRPCAVQRRMAAVQP